MPTSQPPSRLTLRSLLWWVATIMVWSLSSIIFLAGLICILISILGFIDPIGTKMADDGDPFGLPPTLWESALALSISLGITLVGVFIPLGFHHHFRKPHSHPLFPNHKRTNPSGLHS